MPYLGIQVLIEGLGRHRVPITGCVRTTPAQQA